MDHNSVAIAFGSGVAAPFVTAGRWEKQLKLFRNFGFKDPMRAKRSQMLMKIKSLPILMLLSATVAGSAAEPDNSRKPSGDIELRYWLENMVWHHEFTLAEISSATGLGETDVSFAMQ